MKLLNRDFDSFASANYWVKGLSKAIDTSYIPSGDSIEEVVASFLKIQLGRRFNHNCGFGSANLQMIFNEEKMTIWYASTSGTEVLLKFFFDEEMKFNGGSVECWLPDDRVGGCHYEQLTEFIYDYKWSSSGVVEVPPELISLNPDLSEAEFPTPNWVLEEQANRRASDNPAERDAQLLEYGFSPLEKIVGFTRAWKNSKPDAFCPYIVLSEKQSRRKNYFMLREESSVENNFSVSYKRLLEILESHRSKGAEAAEVEEPDYDESGYTEVEWGEDEE